MILLLLFIVGLIVGGINAMGGGGTFLAFPVLMWSGLASIPANIASTLATFPGTLATAFSYRKNLPFAQKKRLIAYSLLGFLGGGMGAILLLLMSNRQFSYCVPYLLFVASCAFTFRNFLTRYLPKNLHVNGLLAVLLLAVASVYGGFFGAGFGIIILAILGITGMRDLHEMNAIRTLIGVSANIVAVILFSFSGKVAWPPTLVMGLGTMIGGHFGGRYFQRLPQRWVHWVIVGLAWGMTSWFIFSSYILRNSWESL